MDTVLEKLQQQLAHYGLDPEDWEVIPEGDGIFKVISPTMELFGRAVEDEWVQLVLKAV